MPFLTLMAHTLILLLTFKPDVTDKTSCLTWLNWEQRLQLALPKASDRST